MPSINITAHRDDEPSRAYVLSSPDGPFIVLRFDGDLSMYTRGFGVDSIAHAREIAATLAAAADEAEAMLVSPEAAHAN